MHCVEDMESGMKFDLHYKCLGALNLILDCLEVCTVVWSFQVPNKAFFSSLESQCQHLGGTNLKAGEVTACLSLLLQVKSMVLPLLEHMRDVQRDRTSFQMQLL